MISVSTVIPTHDRAEQLHLAIKSALSQLERAVEVIVVDDGSNPPTQSQHLPEGVILIRNNTPGGPAAARNAGAAASTGDWIAFLDDDDIWLPGKVEAVIDAVNRFPSAEVICHRTAWCPSTNDDGTRLISDPLARVLHRQPPHISGVTVRRKVHQRVAFDESLWAGEDLDYLIRLAKTATWIEIGRDLGKHGSSGRLGSAIDLKARIEGRLMLMERHKELFQRDPIARSFFYVRLGHQYRRGGLRREALGSFVKAVRIRPTSPIAWKGLARALFMLADYQSRRRA